MKTTSTRGLFSWALYDWANSAYLELLGVTSFDELSIVSLLEVLHQDGTDMKGLIRNLGDATYPPDGESFELSPRNGDPKQVHLSFAPVRYEDEDCVQMLVRSAMDCTSRSQRPAACSSVPGTRSSPSATSWR